MLYRLIAKAFPSHTTDNIHLQNHPGAPQQGQAPPNTLQHPRSAGLIPQHRSNSPLQHSNPLQPTTQGPYASPHSSTHSLAPQHQSPYIGSIQGIHQQHPGETNFFGAHPSPYSTNSAAGSYASSGKLGSILVRTLLPKDVRRALLHRSHLQSMASK